MIDDFYLCIRKGLVKLIEGNEIVGDSEKNAACTGT
jgi:hypothetical protein